MEAMQGSAEHFPSAAKGNAEHSVRFGRGGRQIAMTDSPKNGFKKSSLRGLRQALRQGIASRRRHVAPALSLC
jgi:hypothetical protein